MTAPEEIAAKMARVLKNYAKGGALTREDALQAAAALAAVTKERDEWELSSEAWANKFITAEARCAELMKELGEAYSFIIEFGNAIDLVGTGGPVDPDDEKRVEEMIAKAEAFDCGLSAALKEEKPVGAASNGVKEE